MTNHDALMCALSIVTPSEKGRDNIFDEGHSNQHIKDLQKQVMGEPVY
jgi:hypothetical protein